MFNDEYFIRNNLSTVPHTNKYVGLRTDQCIKVKLTVKWFDNSTFMRFLLHNDLTILEQSQKLTILNLCKSDYKLCDMICKTSGIYRLQYDKYIRTLQGTKSNSTVNEILYTPFTVDVEIYRNKTIYHYYSKFGIEPIVRIDNDHVIPEICWTTNITVEIYTPLVLSVEFY